MSVKEYRLRDGRTFQFADADVPDGATLVDPGPMTKARTPANKARTPAADKAAPADDETPPAA